MLRARRAVVLIINSQHHRLEFEECYRRIYSLVVKRPETDLCKEARQKDCEDICQQLVDAALCAARKLQYFLDGEKLAQCAQRMDGICMYLNRTGLARRVSVGDRFRAQWQKLRRKHQLRALEEGRGKVLPEDISTMLVKRMDV